MNESETIYVNSEIIHHFALDPLVPSLYMAQVNAEGVLLYPDTYFLTGPECTIPANGGQMAAFLCHTPSINHWVHPKECALLKYVYDPWHICTCLLLTNTHPNLTLFVPEHCDIFAIAQNTVVEIKAVAEADFFACIDN